jgi:hypothetical protein
VSATDEIPVVCFIDDLSRVLRISARTIRRARERRTFPIRELPSLDKRPRWAGEDVRRYLQGQRASSLRKVG